MTYRTTERGDLSRAQHDGLGDHSAATALASNARASREPNSALAPLPEQASRRRWRRRPHPGESACAEPSAHLGPRAHPNPGQRGRGSPQNTKRAPQDEHFDVIPICRLAVSQCGQMPTWPRQLLQTRSMPKPFKATWGWRTTPRSLIPRPGRFARASLPVSVSKPLTASHQGHGFLLARSLMPCCLRVPPASLKSLTISAGLRRFLGGCPAGEVPGGICRP